MYKCFSLFMICVLLLTVSGCKNETAHLNHEETQEIERALMRWTGSYNAQDLEQVMAIFSPQVIGTFHGQPDKNFDDLQKMFKAHFADPKKTYHYDLEIDQIDLSGDLAISWLVWSFSENQSGKKSINTREFSVDEWRKMPDGQWKIVRFGGFPLAKEKKVVGFFGF